MYLDTTCSMLHNLLFKARFDQDYPNLVRLCNMLTTCTKMGKHGAGDQTQGSHVQQVSGGACNAVRWSWKGMGIF